MPDLVAATNDAEVGVIAMSPSVLDATILEHMVKVREELDEGLELGLRKLRGTVDTQISELKVDFDHKLQVLEEQLHSLDDKMHSMDNGMHSLGDDVHSEFTCLRDEVRSSIKSHIGSLREYIVSLSRGVATAGKEANSPCGKAAVPEATELPSPEESVETSGCDSVVQLKPPTSTPQNVEVADQLKTPSDAKASNEANACDVRDPSPFRISRKPWYRSLLDSCVGERDGPEENCDGSFERTKVAREYEPRPFDGSKASSWQNYLRYFCLMIDRNRWSIPQAGIHLACCMKEKALDVLCEMEPGESRNFHAIVKHFDERFSSELTTSHYLTLFERFRPMGGTESPSDYAYALREACAKAHPELDSVVRENMCLAKFVNGMPDADMRRLVRMIAPHSLKQAVMLADSYLSGEPTTEKSRKPIPINAAVSARVNEGTSDTSADCPPWIEILVDKLDSVLDAVAKPVKRRASGNNNARSRMCVHCGSSTHRSVECPDCICFHCHAKGHYRRNCPNGSGSNGASSNASSTASPSGTADDLNSRQRH